MTLLVGTGSLVTAALMIGGSMLGTNAAAPGHRPGGAPRHDGAHPAYQWVDSPTGSDARLRGLSAVSREVAWASGTGGTVLRTTDGGRTWDSVGPAGTEALQFRDIEATSAEHAVALSIGEGEDSRVYVTDDGGRSWAESFRNTDARAFYDCMAFFDHRNGLAVSDPVDGKFRLIRTRDGGHSWSLVDPAGMPAAEPGEFGFAASGTCLSAGPGHQAWLATGGVDPARVFSSHDGGSTWSVTGTPVAGAEAGGIFSVRFRDAHRGVVVGGDFTDPTGASDNAAWTTDGGRTWHVVTGRSPGGYRSGSAWVHGTHATALAVGPTGSDVSVDGGRSWTAFDSGSLDSVECAVDGACWASGEHGRVARLTRD